MNSNYVRVPFWQTLSSFEYWFRRLTTDLELTPFRVSVFYAFLGFLALYGSDVLLVQIVEDPLLTQLQALKGGVEVVATALLFFVLTSRRETQLQRQQRHLKHQREELQVLHRVLRHNLRNDLNVVSGYIELARQKSPNISDECQIIMDKIGELTEYTNKAARIKRITDGNGHMETFDLAQEIPAIFEEHSSVNEGVEVSTILPKRCTVEANTMFIEALEELVTNAIDHNTSESPSIEVDVSAERGPPHMVEILVRDNGPGLPVAELAPLQQGREDSLFHLSGMGLWFVQWTIRASEGNLRIDQSDDQGTTVIVQVPKAPGMLSSTFSTLNSD